MNTLLWLCCFGGSPLWGFSAAAELIQVVTVSRHGNRVPNFSVLAACPANRPNLLRFGLPPSSLSRRGVGQLLQLGDAVRRRYVLGAAGNSGDDSDSAGVGGFLPARFEGGAALRLGFGSFFRAAHAARCQQSAAAMAHALYPPPPVTATKILPLHLYSGGGYQPVPVETAGRHTDTVLDATQDKEHGCHAAQARDRRRYDQARGVSKSSSSNSGSGSGDNSDGGGDLVGGGLGALLAPRQVQQLMQRLSDACGGPALLPMALQDASVIKDLSDMLLFDAAEGHTHSAAAHGGGSSGKGTGLVLSDADVAELHALAAALQRARDFRTAAQLQRTLGSFPKTLKATMRAARSRAEWRAAPNAFEGGGGGGGAGAPQHLLYAYHSHRELLVALFHTLGIDLQEAVPSGAERHVGTMRLLPETMPPATTLFFELHTEDGWRSASGDGTRRLRNKSGKLRVAARLWLPPPYCDAGAECIVEVKMHACKGQCHLSAFEHVFKRLRKSTGGWESTCAADGGGDEGGSDDDVETSMKASQAFYNGHHLP